MKNKHSGLSVYVGESHICYSTVQQKLKQVSPGTVVNESEST